MPKREITIEYPRGGENRYGSYSGRTAPFYTPMAINVRNRGVLERRERGGSRPCLSKFIANQMGTTITGLQSVSYVDENGTLQYDIVVLVDGSIKIVDGSSVNASTAYLNVGSSPLTIGGNNIIYKTSTVATSPIGETDSFCIVEHAGKAIIASTKPLVYYAATGIVKTLTNAPASQPIVVVFKERLVLTGNDHSVWFSKMGDFDDYDFGDDYRQPDKAIHAVLQSAGYTGGESTCAHTFKDAYLVVGTADSLWYYNSDPSQSGIKNVSMNEGPIGHRAYCSTDEGVFYFLGREGVYKWTIGSNQRPQPFSDVMIPNSLRNTSTATNDVMMVYDAKNEGINLFITPATGAGTHYWIDTKDNAISTDKFGNNSHQPLAVTTFPGSKDSDVVLAGVDGYLRYFNTAATTDDSTAMNSDLFLGPFNMGGPRKTGMLTELIGDLADNTVGVTWKVVVADTAEECVDNANTALNAGNNVGVFDYGTWAENHNKVERPRARGGWCLIWIDAASRWAYESVSILMDIKGRSR